MPTPDRAMRAGSADSWETAQSEQERPEQERPEPAQSEQVQSQLLELPSVRELPEPVNPGTPQKSTKAAPKPTSAKSSSAAPKATSTKAAAVKPAATSQKSSAAKPAPTTVSHASSGGVQFAGVNVSYQMISQCR